MLKRLFWLMAALLCSLPLSAPAQTQSDPQLMYELLNRLEQIERDPSDPHHIVTVWGVGYRFEP